jgi:uncharacterized protein YecE (DUF72 family)
MTLPLFDPPSDFDRQGLSAKLRRLADSGIWLGTSSWKYEGWLGQVYSEDRYLTRGRFSKKRFEAECLAEFAETFPIVCGDFSFYQFPAPEFWQKLFCSAPLTLKFALKVPEEVTVELFPRHARYGPRAGMANESFLNANLFQIMFLEPLEPYRARIPVLIFEFGSRSTPMRLFVEALDKFLSALPKTFRYAVEVRNREYLQTPYFACLKSHGVAHVLNGWTRMPTISEQLLLPQIIPADFTVVRALLKQGRAYEQAVEKFQPYERIQEENPEAREALRKVIQRMREERKSAYIFVNNRLEGNSPETIRAVVE